MNTADKKRKLEEYFIEKKRVAVAFSAGVDSSFLLAAAHSVLKENVLALTVRSCVFPQEETQSAVDFCLERGIEQIVVDMDNLAIEGFSDNPKDRCYLCKRAVFVTLRSLAREKGFSVLCEGTNADDIGDFRPGMRAVEELGVESPLKDAGLTKKEIRDLSEEAGLSSFNKPSAACLASRFSYGEKITKEKLAAVGEAERFLRAKGFSQVRVRVHGDLARVEILPEDFKKFTEKVRLCVAEKLYLLGFKYASLDMSGYKTGNMNKTIV